MLPSISKIRRELSLAIDAQVARAYATGFIAGMGHAGQPAAVKDMKVADERAAAYVKRYDPQSRPKQEESQS